MLRWLLLALVIYGLVLGCVPPNAGTRPSAVVSPARPAQVVIKAKPYSNSTVRAFMHACLEDLAPTYCACVLVRLQERLPEKELLKRLAEKRSSRLVDKAISACSDLE